jgi:hypothetical protein
MSVLLIVVTWLATRHASKAEIDGLKAANEALKQQSETLKLLSYEQALKQIEAQEKLYERQLVDLKAQLENAQLEASNRSGWLVVEAEGRVGVLEDDLGRKEAELQTLKQERDALLAELNPGMWKVAGSNLELVRAALGWAAHLHVPPHDTAETPFPLRHNEENVP